MNSNVKLSWAGFSAKSPQTLRDILQEKEHTDVTLATEDGTQILAHQVILSSGSVFFKRILKMSNIHQQRPLLFLSGLEGSLLAALVDFIYLGQCSVKEESLDQVVKSGKEFGLRGIEEVALEDVYYEGGEAETLTPSLLEIGDLGDKIYDEEHPLELDLETTIDDGTFQVNPQAGHGLGLLEDPNGDGDVNIQLTEKQTIETLPFEKPTAVVVDLLDTVSDEDDDGDGEDVINPLWNLNTMTGILASEIVSDDLTENLEESKTQINAVSYPVEGNSESDELLDLEVDDLLRDVEESVGETRRQKAEEGDLANAANSAQELVSNKSLRVDVKKLHLVGHNGASSKKSSKFYCNLSKICKYTTSKRDNMRNHRCRRYFGKSFLC